MLLLAINANLTHNCCDVYECMFSGIISVAYITCMLIAQSYSDVNSTVLACPGACTSPLHSTSLIHVVGVYAVYQCVENISPYSIYAI